MHYAHKDRRTRVRMHIYDKLVIIKTGRSHQTRSLNFHRHPQETLPLRSPPNGAGFTARGSHRSRRGRRSSDVNYYDRFSPYRPGEGALAISFPHAQLHAGVKDSLTSDAGPL